MYAINIMCGKIWVLHAFLNFKNTAYFFRLNFNIPKLVFKNNFPVTPKQVEVIYSLITFDPQLKTTLMPKERK